MPVGSSDIKLFKSSVGDSEGGTATATEVTGTAKNNLWADVSDIERAADGTRYKKVFVGNDHLTDSLVAPKLWIDPDVPGFIPTALGVGFDETDDNTALTGTLVALGANAQIELVSSAADTRTVTLVGINSVGSVPASENVVLSGTTPVLGTITFSKLFAAQADAEHATNTITIKQGAGGTVRGTIAPMLLTSFLWINASSEGTALHMTDVIAGERRGLWMKQSWVGGVLPQRPASPKLNLKEGV